MIETQAERVAAEVRGQLARRRRTQSELADYMGVSQATVNRRLVGDVAFNVDELAAVAAFLDLPIEALLATHQAAS